MSSALPAWVPRARRANSTSYAGSAELILKLWRSFTSSATSHSPVGADVRTELDSDLVGTPLFRYLENGLELVELTGGGASGTLPGHGEPRAARTSAPRHGSTRASFTVKSTSTNDY